MFIHRMFILDIHCSIDNFFTIITADSPPIMTKIDRNHQNQLSSSAAQQPIDGDNSYVTFSSLDHPMINYSSSSLWIINSSILFHSTIINIMDIYYSSIHLSKDHPSHLCGKGGNSYVCNRLVDSLLTLFGLNQRIYINSICICIYIKRMYSLIICISMVYHHFQNTHLTTTFVLHQQSQSITHMHSSAPISSSSSQ
jgi:hypothetical protein